mmetsp:Transcript_11986/g.34231  ORF Transcript_11986/g.34231 Transcript_11986/m.34231 type:complete len:220 (+) Transcript_11986:539-1198(+)
MFNNASNFFNSSSFSRPTSSSSSENVPLPSLSNLLTVCLIRLVASSRFFRISFMRSAASASLLRFARSTMTARIRLVKPREMEISADAQMRMVHGYFRMIGIVHLPQESPARSVWKNNSMHASTDLRAVRHQSSSPTSTSSRGKISSTVSIPRHKRRMKIMTPPQNIAIIAITKPRIIEYSSGKNRINRTTRSNLKMRKIRKNFTLGRLLSTCAMITSK